MMRAMFRLVVLMFSLVLVACGGGGGGNGGAAQPPASASATITVGQNTLGINSITEVQVRVTRGGGGNIQDGTVVTLSVSPSNLGQVGAASGENQGFGNNATAVTTGGTAHFRFKSTTQTGTATLSASLNDPNTPATNISAQTTVTLNGGPSNDRRLQLEADRQIIPLNSIGLPPSCRNFPYQAEVRVEWRNLRGELVTAPQDDEAVRASWTSLDGVGALSTPDDPDTDENECEMNFASTRVIINAGRGTVFVRSLGNAGTGILTVGVRDEDTGEDLSAQLQFTFTAGAPALPATVTVVPVGPASYVNTSRQLQIFVDDGAGSPVPNPQSGGQAWNNVRLEIINPQPGERLRTTNAAGATAEGVAVNTRTNNGVAGAVFIASDRQGSITLRATADRADNDVDNGIADPVSGEAVVVVSDGQLFSLTLTTPVLESLFVNRQDLTLPSDSDEEAPPDGTYSLTVSAIATDRLGNPVLPTDLQFGLIDAPLVGFPGQGSGTFSIAGGNGDPQEGGTLFTAPGGAFTTAGGGVGPGDTLVLFGKDVVGNADHEGSRIVQSVNSSTSLTVERRFNLNDTTGQSVNSGPVIPYVIGRATVGNIGATARTNATGVATVRMTYPVTQLGRRAIVWVQGNGPQVAGQPKTVGDVEHYGYYGMAPAVLSAFPSSITANQTQTVFVCLQDARNEAIQGASFGFAFENLESGTGRANGIANSGIIGTTGADGCVTVTVVTSGIQAGQGENPRIRFFGYGEDAIVDIVGGEQAPPEVETFTLTITVTGNGVVTGSASTGGFSPPSPGGNTFICTAAQSPCVIANLRAGANIAMTAVPEAGSSFGSWSQDCTGANPATSITMGPDRSCTATFTTP